MRHGIVIAQVTVHLVVMVIDHRDVIIPKMDRLESYLVCTLVLGRGDLQAWCSGGSALFLLCWSYSSFACRPKELAGNIKYQ